MDLKIDEEILKTFIDETRERLTEMESSLLHLERFKKDYDEEMVHSMFRSAHSIKANANLLKFKHIEEISQKLEDILEMFRQRKLVPGGDIVTVVLEGIDKIRELLNNLKQSDSINISSQIEKLTNIV